MLPDSWHAKRKLKTTEATLGAIGGTEAIPQLAKALYHKKEKVRQAAAWALGETGCVEAVPYLLAALHDPDWLTRRAAIVAPGKIGDSSALPRLIALLAENNPDLKAEIALVIVKIAPAEASAILAPCLSNETPTTIPKFEGLRVCDVVLIHKQDFED